MDVPRSTTLRRALLITAAASAAGCVIISTSIRVDPLRYGASDSAVVQTPVRAHLADGSTIVYRQGVTVARNRLIGNGQRFTGGVTSYQSTPVTEMGLDSVVGMEAFRSVVNTGRTMTYSVLSSAVAITASVAILKALFGSCPTIYADSAGGPVLEAEGFSYSISPLLEARDIDRLRAQPGADGVLRLQVWNEALETHYINHLELLETRHAADEYALTDPTGRPVAVKGYIPAAAVTDRAGRDLRQVLEHADGDVFRTDPRTLDGVDLANMQDHVDLVLPRLDGFDSLAVILRLRNSLLNTTLFYDYMLAAPGARSLDWMAKDLERIDRTVELGRWYASRFGLRIAVFTGGRYEQVAKVSDAGPIAWHDVAAIVPVPSGDSLRIRLSFLADQWRIDRVAVAARIRRLEPITVPLGAVAGSEGTAEPRVAADLRAADERYLQTLPSQRFTAQFPVGAVPGGDTVRTFFLASQGYYTEWVRGGWMTGMRDTATFQPSDTTLLRVLRSYATRRDDMERRFYSSRIPVR